MGLTAGDRVVVTSYNDHTLPNDAQTVGSFSVCSLNADDAITGITYMLSADELTSSNVYWDGGTSPVPFDDNIPF